MGGGLIPYGAKGVTRRRGEVIRVVEAPSKALGNFEDKRRGCCGDIPDEELEESDG